MTKAQAGSAPVVRSADQTFVIDMHQPSSGTHDVGIETASNYIPSNTVEHLMPLLKLIISDSHNSIL